MVLKQAHRAGQSTAAKLRGAQKGKLEQAIFRCRCVGSPGLGAKAPILKERKEKRREHMHIAHQHSIEVMSLIFRYENVIRASLYDR